MGPAAVGNGTDRFLLLLWGVTSHDPGMFMRPDSRRPWRRTAAEKPNQRASGPNSLAKSMLGSIGQTWQVSTRDLEKWCVRDDEMSKNTARFTLE
ncbi:hypothetical protein K0M31_013549 [Melipona bicolor]|uniref:Uncharacterized protein n=1 Tax=Melipona bicolor TaxID=60889 RepID=A0AA40FHU4_9HYME|nr:hypothetical protein K0M31_013549 [Melipona bicolor]